jgi:arginine:pyruvate transaminase
MRYAAITDRVAQLGAAKWEIHVEAKARIAAGEPILTLAIGEPDMAPPHALIEAAKAAMDAGRIGYSNGRGEAGLLAALAAKYSRRSGRAILPSQIIALPGTQTALYATLTALVGPGDEVLVGDPLYATYEGLIAATGATIVPVPLRPEFGFRMQVRDVAERITPSTRLMFLNTPHNPTGAVLSGQDIAALGDLANAHDLWILSDEVYEEMIFGNTRFASPFDQDDLAGRVVVVSSISKSHALPGFRSGWAIGPQEFADRLQPVAETMLFGNQPFLADATALAVSQPSTIAPLMAEAFARRVAILRQRLNGQYGLAVNTPEAGMFALVDVRATGLSGNDFAWGLLNRQQLAVMPGESFGAALNGWLRLGLTVPDAMIEEAAARILRHAAEVTQGA